MDQLNNGLFLGMQAFLWHFRLGKSVLLTDDLRLCDLCDVSLLSVSVLMV